MGAGIACVHITCQAHTHSFACGNKCTLIRVFFAVITETLAMVIFLDSKDTMRESTRSQPLLWDSVLMLIRSSLNQTLTCKHVNFWRSLFNSNLLTTQSYLQSFRYFTCHNEGIDVVGKLHACIIIYPRTMLLLILSKSTYVVRC